MYVKSLREQQEKVRQKLCKVRSHTYWYCNSIELLFYFRVAPFLESVGCTLKVYGSSKKSCDPKIITIPTNAFVLKLTVIALARLLGNAQLIIIIIIIFIALQGMLW